MNKEKNNDENSNNYSTIIAIVIAAVVFVAAYLVYVNYLTPTIHYINGVEVVGNGNINAQFNSIFSSKNITVGLVAQNLTDNTLTCPSFTLAKASIVLASLGKNVTAIGMLSNNTCVDSKNNTIACTHASLIVGTGSCDCIKLDSANNQVVVSGSQSWLCTYADKIANTLGYELNNNGN